MLLFPYGRRQRKAGAVGGGRTCGEPLPASGTGYGQKKTGIARRRMVS